MRRRHDPIAVPLGHTEDAAPLAAYERLTRATVLRRAERSQTQLDAQVQIIRDALLVREGMTITPAVASERARNIVQQLQALEVE